ncbi:MAG: hypothetical protein QM820_37735 [Minicystis sp.]
MTATTITGDRATLEAIPRRTLAWGGGLLVLGLGAVGVGAADEGAVLALTGLWVTIYGIHSFGRLGPEEAEDEGRVGAAIDRARATGELWTGGGLLAMGLAVSLGTYLLGGTGRFWLAYGAILGGLVRMVRGYGDLGKAQRQAARPAVDEAPADGEQPRARRRRGRRRSEDRANGDG